MKSQVKFYECEHSGDLHSYEEDLIKCGAKVLNSSVDEDAEEGLVEIEFADKKAFLDKFRETNSYAFSHLAYLAEFGKKQ